MAPTTAFASVRFYYPPGDRRLSHWRVIRFDVATGKILERWTDPLVDALPFSWDPIGKRVFYTSSRRGQSESVIEVLDKPGGKPRFLANGTGFVFPSPNRESAAVSTDLLKLEIIRLRTGNILFSRSNAYGLEWIDDHRFKYLRVYDKGPDAKPATEPYIYDLRNNQATKHTSSSKSSNEATFTIASEFLGETVNNYIVYPSGKRRLLIGDDKWTARWKTNVIQGLHLGEQLPDGRFEIHTYAHRSCGQVVGKLDPVRGKIAYWFSSPGDYRVVPDSEWMIGWPLQVFTDYGRILVEESPVYRARIDQPTNWDRIWPGAHHLGQLWYGRRPNYINMGM